MTEVPKVEIINYYNDYRPPADFRRSIERLLETVPSKYLIGLERVVLTNFSGQSRRDRLRSYRSRKRKVPATRVAGFYSQAWKGTAASITIYVDKLVLPNRGFRWMPIWRDLLVATVFYHELGHHAHRLVPEFHEREDVADTWRNKFIVNHLRKKYWYLKPLFTVLAKIVSHRKK